jgi:CRISPR-associated protein Cmr5
MSKPKTLDQQRAEHAWDVIQKVKGKAEAEKKQFGTQAKKLPARIMAAGLGQALAFLMAKEYAQDLQSALSDWLAERRKPRPDEDRRLLVRLLRGDADFQRYATAEALAYLVWLVRFADAEKLTGGEEG